MKLKIDHLNLTVSSLSESLKWYQDIFGLEKVEEGKSSAGTPYMIIMKDDYGLCLYEHPDRGRPGDLWGVGFHIIRHFGFRVEDRKKWEEVVEKYQLPLGYGGVVEYPHSLSWYVFDPSGHEIEVSYSFNESLKFN